MNHIVTEIASALGRRLGTLAGGALLALGVETSNVSMIEAGIAAAVCVAFDLVLTLLRDRKKGIR